MAVTNRRKARDGSDVEARPSSEPSGPHYRSNSQPFAGRLGANQAYVIEGGTPKDDHLLHHAPDATPHMSFRELMDMRPIKNLDLWKAALIEGIGTILHRPASSSRLTSSRHFTVRVHHDMGEYFTEYCSSSPDTTIWEL
jgi:hypothetical protein